ncbi:MAG: response regulator [Acidobacteriota bacterium]
MGKKKNILIVDDEKDIGNLLKDFLEGEGFDVTLACDGKKAAILLEEIKFDLMIIDMLLPGEHGIDLILNMKNKFMKPVIVMSGVYSRKEILSILKDYNVKYFFKKPFDLAEILKCVKQLFYEESL